MPEEDYKFTPASRLMQTDEIETIARIFVEQGVNKIRLTGGEPLVRKDAEAIIKSLAPLPVQLTLTTNGTRVHHFMDVLEESGIKSLNISLDTLEPDRYNLITRRNEFHNVWNNIQLLLKRNFHVKVNVVVMKGLNEGEINDFVALTKDLPLHVRFIEFMPFSGNRWTSDKVFTLDNILDTVASRYGILPLPKELNQTAKRFVVPGHIGTFAVISTMSSHFCGDCNRMRLTADGKLKNCLFSKNETDLLSAFRRGEDIRPLIHQSILGKAAQLGGQFVSDFEKVEADSIENRSMITIGG